MSSLRPVTGTAVEVLNELRDWEQAPDEPEPLVIETSGSTGRPKRVLLSRAAMRASASATHARLGGPGAWLLALSPTYVAGVQVLFRSLVAGAEPVVVGDDLPGAVARVPGPRRYLSLVPTQLRRALASDGDVAALRLLDAVLVGGGPADPAVLRAAESAGVRAVTTYGMSETCGGCVYDGVPLDGVAVAVGEDMRVRVAGPVLFDGYDGDPAGTRQVLADGWFLTSDVGRLDDDGRLEVLGRVDDVVVSGGVNVPGPAVAARLREHPAVAAAEVLGVPDAEWGRRVVAVVVPSPVAEPPGPELLRAWVSARLPRAWAPREVLTVEALPMLGTGKVDRVGLERLVAARSGAGGT